MSVTYRIGVPEISVRPVWTAGVASLVATKAGDLLTTVLGLVYVEGLTERNPVAAAVFESAGVPGLVAVSLAGIALVVVVVEGLVSYLERHEETDLDPRVPYFLGYVPLIAIFAFATVHNAVLVLGAG